MCSVFRKKALLCRACHWFSSLPVFLWCMCQENLFQTALLNHIYILRRRIGLNVYKVIQNYCRSFNNLSYTVHLR